MATGYQGINGSKCVAETFPYLHIWRNTKYSKCFTIVIPLA